MTLYTLIKFLHILFATVLFGTGLGIAYFMFRSHSTENLHEKYYAARHTFLADTVFTLPAVLLQPITGFWLLAQTGYNPTSDWLLVTYCIYFIAGMCWLPVVWIQLRLKNILAECLEHNVLLPPRYHTLFTCWFLLGWPAFIALVIVSALMVTKIQ